MELKSFISEWYKTHSPKANFALIKQISKNSSYINILKAFVEFESDDIGQLLYHFTNDIKDVPKCPNCQNKLKFVSLSTGYLTFCSKNCKTSYDHKTGKFKNGHIQGAEKFKKEYGKNGKNHNKILRKREETCKERYGVSHPMKDPQVVARYMNSCIEKYGETNPMKTDEVKSKVSKTNFENYGTSRPIQNKEIFEKMFSKYKKTIEERYGVECVFQDSEILKKAQDNSFRRFRYEDTNLFYQASYEKDFLDFCMKMNILDKVSNGPFVWYMYDGKKKRYFSDFFIEELNLIIEIKSSHWYNMYKEQNEAKKEECIRHGFGFMFIIDKNYESFLKYIQKKIKYEI